MDFVPWVVALWASPASSGPQCQMDSFLTPPTAFCFFALEKSDPRIALSTSDIKRSDRILS
jgi:hypothetical protein